MRRVAFLLLVSLIYAALALPIIIVIGASFTAGGFLRFPPDGLSLRWWHVMLDDPAMLTGFVVTARVALLTVLVCVPVGALAALQIRRAGGAGGWLALAFAAPLNVPLVLTGFALLAWMTRLGLLNEAGLVLGHIVVCLPYVTRTVLSSLALTDPAVARAAAIHGATPARVLLHAVLPALRPGLVSGGLFALLASVNNIIISVFLAQPGASPLPVVIFSRMENLAEPSVAAASATVVLLTALLCLVLEWRYALFRSLAGR